MPKPYVFCFLKMKKISQNVKKTGTIFCENIHYLQKIWYNIRIIAFNVTARGDRVIKKEMIAMLLAGGQGSRLGVLTAKVAKPAVAFGGKYRIIDFPLSNCINSGIDTVGVLTQYQPLRLNTHIGIGMPWDLDRNNGGVTILSPYEKSAGSDWYSGTANAIYQNIDYIDTYNPD